MRMWWIFVLACNSLSMGDDNVQCDKLAELKASRMNYQNGSFVRIGFHVPVTVQPGETAKLVCNIFAYRGGDPKYSPEVDLRWFHEGKELKANDKIRIDGCKKTPFIPNTKLTILEVSAANVGKYSCQLWIKGKHGIDPPFASEDIDLVIPYPTTSTYITSTGGCNTTIAHHGSQLRWLTMFLPVPILGAIIIFVCCCVCKYDETKKGGSACIRYVYEKILLRKKQAIAHDDMAVHYSAANSHETKNLVEGIERAKHGDIESICKKYTRFFPFLTEADVKDISDVEIERERMQCNLQHAMPIVLGTGNFGQVYAGTVLNPKGSITPVAVKKLNDGYSTEQLGNFLREVVTLMRAGNHINVVSLVATIVLDTLDETTLDRGVKVQRPPILVMELATGGNLRKYLQDNRKNFAYSPVPQSDWSLKDESNTKKLDMQSLVSFGYQIARGMEHLSNRNILHRDLAARNILLTDQLVAKIADFGLSKFITDEKQYYRVNHQGITPAKWTAPESLWTSKFTVKSDVWSYGVLLWEILTLGNQPYVTIPACKLYEFLTAGNRLKRPNLATFELHEIMLTCWAWDPNLRPDFSTLVQKMSDVMIGLSKQPYPSYTNSRMRLTSCSNERDSGMSCGTSSLTESCFDSRSDTPYSSTMSYGSYASTDTVIALEDDGPRERASTIAYEIMNPLYENNSSETGGPRERASTIAYEIMNPLYENNSSETGDTASIVYVNDISEQV